ncbi:MAG: SRPBCC family protein [Pseudomonas sp.]|uniref:SRPBCC family protein n=1 Tax=Pseudomonas sp. TaxID=306 RepID=UPI003D0B5605
MKVKPAVSSIALACVLASPLGFAGAALQAERQVTLNASPAEVWETVGNFNGLHAWHPGVTNSELRKGSNNQVGAERLLTLGNGATISERLVGYSDSDRQYRYIILESPLPVRDYTSTLRVDSAANGQSRVTWNATFNAVGVSDDEAIKVIDGVYDGGLEQLGRQFPQ